jgi:heavy metal sensor kinase
MIEFLQRRVPIRWRLTLWYLLLMGLTFTAFSIFLIFRFGNSLQASIDSSLQITVSKTIAALDEEDFAETGTLTFDHTGMAQPASNAFAMQIISLQAEVWDLYGASERVSGWGKLEAGYSTQGEWRIHSQPIVNARGETIGWMQAAQSLQPLQETLGDLREQLLFGVLLVLLLAGAGGYFLANRALSPVDHIMQTAKSIDVEDLSRRIHYQGAMDEVGRLAQTFDQMLARLQDSFERERRFSADAAHELRTPLTVLKGQIEVTLSRTRGSAEYEAKLQELSHQVDRLIRLSNALLFLSRSGQNQILFHPTPVNLTELLDVLIEQLNPLASEKRLDVSAQLAEDAFVRGDKDHLIRLFMNLLGNAHQYTPDDGQVRVIVEKEANRVRVAIHNSGEGIAPEHIPHLFKRFYRVDEARSSGTGGSGLGLAISHEIVRLHGGDIAVQSEMGKGVTVLIHLPPAEHS